MDTILVSVTAKIDKGWHIYSASEIVDDGPIITKISIDSSKCYQPIDSVTPIGDKEIYSTVFDEKIQVFTETATYKQPIIIFKCNRFSIVANVEYQVCSDQLGKCYYGKEKIEIPISIQDNK